MIPQGAIRFEAEWITREHQDKHGEWDPDLAEYGHSYHTSRDAAERAAIAGSKRANQAEWILVAEQEYHGYKWRDVRRWTGDWDGLHEESLTEEDNGL